MSIWPPIVLLALMCVGVGNSLAKFGQQKTDKYDFIDVLIGPGIVIAILWWGNFFAPLSK